RELVLVGSQDLRVEVRLLGLAHLAGLRVDRLLLLLDRLRLQLLLQLRRQDQLEDPKGGRVGVEIDARVLGGVRRLLVRRQQRILQRRHQGVGVDSLLLFEAPDRIDDLATHLAPSSGLMWLDTRLDRRIRDSGISTSPASAARRTRRSSAAVSVPVKLRCPSIASRVLTLTRRPMKRR